METGNLCRCCLSQGPHKDLNATYVWLNQTEVYAEMLSECFNVILSSSDTMAGICDLCIKILRDSLQFKQQVLKSEQEFLKRVEDVKNESKLLEVKLEPKEEGNDVGDDSDDYFLADAAREVSIIKVKHETKDSAKKKPEHRRKVKASVKSKKQDEGSQDVNMLVSRVATSIDSSDLPKLNVTPKPAAKPRTRSIPINPNIKVSWTSRAQQDRAKHRENLLTILKYSNAMPFKNKSLLGFTCGFCPSSFPDPADLRRHTRSRHRPDHLDPGSNLDLTKYSVKLDVTDLACTICDQKQDNLNKLKDHLVKSHSKNYHADVKDHMLQFKLKKGEVYDCTLCTSTYETFKMLKQHMNKHYCNYTCDVCNSTFATKRSLSAHATTHQRGSFKCDYCDEILTTKPKKYNHEKTKHLGNRNISNCPFCNEPFTSYYQRNQHLVRVHNAEAQYKCNVCSKSYILKSLLMYHIKKNHLMEKDYQCTECGFRFFSKKALKAHMIKHTGERIHTCAVCNKSYARKYTLREHMRIHDNDRRFRCSVCSMTFVQKCSLKSHLLSNHGISMAASDITSDNSDIVAS